MDYLKIIDKYFKGNEKAKNIYLIHVSLVTAKAIKIAKGLGLSEKQIRFIEEAAMLHDIGIVKTDTEDLFCYGNLPYICHITEGAKILQDEGYLEHAKACEVHTGVGITKKEILAKNLPLERKDYFAETIEQKIIAYSDIFFRKVVDELLFESSVEEARNLMLSFSKEHVEKFNKLHARFGKF